MVITTMNVLLKKFIQPRTIALKNFSLEIKVKPTTEKWDVYAAVSLERLPVISRDYNEMETKFSKLLAQLEYENSHKSNFEIRLESDLIRAKQLQEGTIDNIDMDSIPQQTGQDFLDASYEELKAFKFASRKQDENIEKNMKSSGRALDRRLLLLVEEKIGEKKVWVLPSGIFRGEESLRLTAEKALVEKCGSNINVRFLGHCPCGFYKYRYPKKVRNDSVGAKYFFFKAQLLNGQVDDVICNNFQWATRKELQVLHKDYKKTVEKFLIDEEH